MHFREDKTAPSRWVPWILALAVLFGWNALSPERQATGKAKLKDGIRLVDQSDEQPSSGVPTHSASGLPAAETVGTGKTETQCLRLGVESLREVPRVERRSGAVQGRAPPVLA